MGNRFQGRIMPGACRGSTNGLASLCSPLSADCSSIVRSAISTAAVASARTLTIDAAPDTGMEFASEMVIKSTCRMSIAEVPSSSTRTAAPVHPTCGAGATAGGICDSCFCSVRGGCSGTRAPRFSAGFLGSLWLWGGERHVGGVSFDIHTMLVAAFACLLGYQLIIFALFTKIFAVTEGLHPSTHLSRVPREINLEFGVSPAWV